MGRVVLNNDIADAGKSMNRDREAFKSGSLKLDHVFPKLGGSAAPNLAWWSRQSRWCTTCAEADYVEQELLGHRHPIGADRTGHGPGGRSSSYPQTRADHVQGCAAVENLLVADAGTQPDRTARPRWRRRSPR